MSAASKKIIDRRSDYDVTNRVRTTDVSAVAAEVRNIYVDLFSKSRAGSLTQPFEDFEALYSGEFPGFRACDTGYHDVQHVLDVTLAMARRRSPLRSRSEMISFNAVAPVSLIALCIIVLSFNPH